MQEEHDMEIQEPERKYVSNALLQLELRALRAEQASEHKSTRLWLVGAIAASGLISHVTLPPSIGVPSAAAVIAAVVAKVVFFK